MAERNVSVRIQAIGGEKVRAEFAQIGRTGTQSLQSIEKSSKSMRFGVQNAAFQVQDFFVQVSGGTSATRALAQQLPQLLGSFGLFGALAGTAVAALVPLFASFFDGKEKAEDLSKTLDRMEKSAGAATESLKQSRVPLAELRKEYGDLADEIERMRKAGADLDRSRAGKDVTSSVGGIASQIVGTDLSPKSRGAFAEIDGDIAGLIEKTEILRDSLADVRPLSPEEAGITAQIRANQELIDVLTDGGHVIDDMADKYRLSADEAVRVLEATLSLRDADGPKAQAVAADELLNVLIDVYGSVEDIESVLPGIVDDLRRSADTAAGLATELGFSADEAARLADAIDRGARNRGLLAPGASLRALDDERGSQADGLRDLAVWRSGQILESMGLNPDGSPKRTSGRRGGGGGAGQRAGLNEAKRLFEETRTSAEKYAIEVERVNELHKKFGSIVTDEVADRALKKLEEEFKGASDAAKQAAQAIRGAFDNLFDDPIAALKDLGKQLLQMALYQQLALSFPKAFGAGGVIPLVSFAGGGYTGGTARSGGLDGMGGFLAMLHPQETVTDHTKGGGGGGGTTVQVINQTGQPARTETTKGPDGRDLVRVMVGDEIARGGFDKPMKGRFGAAPYAVKR